MTRGIRYQYFVEDGTDKKIIEEFKKTRKMIVTGTINVFNVKQKKLSNARLMNLSDNTVVILVFDTDTKEHRYSKR